MSSNYGGNSIPIFARSFASINVLFQLNEINPISYLVLESLVLFVSTSDKVIKNAELGNKRVVYVKLGSIAIPFTTF